MKHQQTSRRRWVSLLAVAILIALPVLSIAQKQNYPWVELSKKDAERMLANSPWSQTQVDTDLTEQFYTPTRPGTSAVGQPDAARGSVSSQQSTNNNRADRGALNQAVSVKYRISFLSSRPVRQALAKMILSAQKEPNPADPKEVDGFNQLMENLQEFVERDFSPYIAIAVLMTSADDGRVSGPAMQAINSATTGTLKNKAFLERQDGKRLFIQEYHPPISDNLGAKFIFPRVVDNEPFLNSTSGTVRFYAEFNDSFKINMRFKVADMVYLDKLEY